MKKLIFKGLAIAMALALLCASALAEVRTTGDIWMRTGPGLSYETVTSIASGKSLDYLGETSVDERGVAWYKVTNGTNTGWVSSKYAELVGEEEAPTQAPEETPIPTEEPAVTEPAVEGGSLFSESVAEEGEQPEESAEAPEESAEAPEETPVPEEEPAEAPGEPVTGIVELSGYYLGNLVEAANEIGLISYRQVEAEAPYQYYDDSVILAGNQLVEKIVVYGPGYELYGVYVGMSANAAKACLNAAGLDYISSDNGITYEHRGSEGSIYTDVNGHDSCINLWLDENDTVIEIDWNSYTG